MKTRMIVHMTRRTIIFGIICISSTMVTIGILWWGVVNDFSMTRSQIIIPETPTPVLIESIKNSTETQMQPYLCDEETVFATSSDIRWCYKLPVINRMRLIQIDLTHQTILFFEHGILRKTFPIAYQAPYGKWYQTPTGFFQVGVKREKFMSSIFPVWMEHAVQLYEDFFIHGIPYHPDGTKVTSQFSGGCIRLEDMIAEDFYNIIQKNDAVVSYLALDDASVAEHMYAPVDTQSFWIRQRFNAPLKTDWSWYEDKQYNYIQHAGVDFAPRQNATNTAVYAVATGTIESVIYNGNNDAGLGNAIIIKHTIGNTSMYGLYAHLATLEQTQIVGATVYPGEVLGTVGNTGYGCKYWHVGVDGCEVQNDEADVHLHFELKTKPITTSPEPDTCMIPSGKKTRCVGYTSHNPTQFGYYDPLPILFQNGVIPQ